MDKQKKIVNMFDNIASTYDTANRVLSFGIDKTWRKKACDLTYRFYDKDRIDSILDVACGTGDMCDYWLKRADANGIIVDKIDGIDPSIGMLEVAKNKLLNVNFIEGEAKTLPFKDKNIDILSITYGIRNVIDRKEAFNEFNRVLKDGGLLVILEFTKKDGELSLSGLTREFYMKNILPLIGGLVSKNFEAYTYLPNSIDNFLTDKKIEEELISSEFETLYLKSFSMDISTLFIVRKMR